LVVPVIGRPRLVIVLQTPHNSDAGPRPPTPARSSKAAFLFALVIGLSLGVLSVGSLGWLMLSRDSGRALLSRMWSAVTGRTLSIDVSQPTVVDRIQRLQRLETVVYTMDKLVTGAKENAIFPDFLAGDRLLMMVHGEVVAGIDFSNLKPGDVKVDGKQIRPWRRCSAPESTARRRGSTPGKLACSYLPTRTWKRKCARRRSVNCKKPP
jgi:hypothetical protein